MKTVSTMALGLALACGAVAVVGTQPALAKDKKAGSAKPASYSADVRTALVAVQEALKANDTATATAKLAEAKAAVKTDDDRYGVGSLTYELGNQTKTPTLQLEGIDMMLASGKVGEDQLGKFYLVQGQLALQQKQYQKAEVALDQAAKLNANDPNVYALQVEAKAASGKPADAVEALEAAIAKQKAAGQPTPSEWYGRGLNIALTAKNVSPADKARLNASIGRIAEAWVSAYPTKSNWRDTLLIYRDSNKIDADQELDMLRLLRANGALRGERDFMDYVQMTYMRYPGEAKAVLEDGRQAGTLNLATAGNPKEIYDLVKGKVTADKASLGASATTAKGAKGTAKTALATADAYLGYADYPAAIDLYKVALTKTGADAAVINTRLGIALAMSGQKDAARQAFAAVTGPRAQLAKYWTIWLDHPATA